MELGWDFFTFPFRGKDWEVRAVIGTGLAFVGSMFASYLIGFVLWIPLMGFGVRIMRQTMQGSPPSLPDWDDWNSLFRDGFHFLVVLVVYLLPVILFICAGVGIFVAAIMGGAAFIEENPAAGFGFVVGELGMFMLMGVGFGLGIPLGLLAFTGMTRVVAEERLSAAFELGKVWSLLRRSGGRFVLSYVMLAGLYFVGTFLVQISVYTIILCFIYPVLLGLLMYYMFVMSGALFGAAYYETEGAPHARPAAGPAADVAPAAG